MTKANSSSDMQMVTVRIAKVVAQGDGFGRLGDGRVVFVEGALPGEIVSARIVKQSRDYARAVTVTVIQPSAERVQPPCDFVAKGCGGCDFQHASVTLQRQIKCGIVIESLQRLGKVPTPDVRLFDTTFLPTDAARTTLRLAATSTGRVGFRKRRSHEVVPIDHCLVAHSAINELLPHVHLDGADEAVIRVGVASGERMVWAEPEGTVMGIGADIKLGRRAIVHETVAGHDFQISAESFFQSSPQAAEALVDAVGRALGNSETWPPGPLIDAYCGVGLFARILTPSDRRVIAIEENPSACIDARRNLSVSDIAYCDAQVIQLAVEEWTPCPAAAVIADPARDGLRSAGVNILVATKAPVIVLVSCDPASLGRDARLLGEAGYRLDYSEVLDLFPHTHHVEVVSRFICETMSQS